MNIEIKNRFTGEIILVGEYESVKDALEKNSGKSFYYADLSGSDLSGSDLRGINLRGSDLSGSDLSDSDLRGSDLSGSDLRDSDLRDSDLRGSDLSGSNLRDSGITFPIINLSGSVHSVWAMGDIIKIGCERHTIPEWLADYKQIGEDNNYTEEQIAEYKGYIDMVAALLAVKDKVA